MNDPAARYPMTFEDVAALDPDEHAGDVVDGRWVPVTKNTWRHGEVLINIGVALKLWAREHPGYSISGGDPGTKLQHDPAKLRGPDVGVVRSDRKPTGRGVDGWLDGAPDLAIEIAGDAQTYADLTAKALEYLRAGAKAVWIVDADAERVIVFTPPDHVRILGREDVLDGDGALDDFRAPVTDFFALGAVAPTRLRFSRP